MKLDTEKIFYTKSVGLQNFFEENGIQPIYNMAEYAIYDRTKKLEHLFDRYWIKYNIFKEKC